jgi:protein TonB
MNDEKYMTSQPDPGATHRCELTPPANRFTTRLLLQRTGAAKNILSNLKDLLIVRSPKFAHSSSANRTITIKDENFGRSQVASFALHGSLALMLFLTIVTTRPPTTRPTSHNGFDSIFAPPHDFLQKLTTHPGVLQIPGSGSGGERSPIPVTIGVLPPATREQIVAPSAHTFPNAVMLVPPTLEGPESTRVLIGNLENWGDPHSSVRTNSDGSGCCSGMGNNRGTGIGDGAGSGAGLNRDGSGVGNGAIGPPGSGVRAPTCLYCPRPEYSDEARKVRFQGLVEISVVIQADGKTGRIEVLSSPGLGLDEKAIEAVRTWRFNPAIGPNGKPVAVLVPIEVQFQMF